MWAGWLGLCGFQHPECFKTDKQKGVPRPPVCSTYLCHAVHLARECAMATLATPPSPRTCYLTRLAENKVRASAGRTLSRTIL
jgi:hypothetical protein